MSIHSLAKQLETGALNASTLQTALGNSDTLWEFTQLIATPYWATIVLESSTSFDSIFGSALAKAKLFSHSIPLRIIASSDLITQNLLSDADKAVNLFSNKTLFEAYLRNYNNYQRLKSFINVAGSKLKRVEFLSSGTFTIPGTGLKAMSIAGVGNGSYGYNGPIGNGGAGGEYASKKLLTGLPTSNVTVTIQAMSNSYPLNNTFGSILSVSNGESADNFGPGIGGGVTTNGGKTNISDPDIQNAVLQFYDLTVQGGAGGVNSSITNGKGGDGIFGKGGGREEGGTGIISGGGSYTPGGSIAGTVGQGLGCGGGGSSSGLAAAGSTGGFIVYYLENN